MNWPQLKTLLWLRWRLTRRQWTRSGGAGAVIAAIVTVMALVMAAGGFTGGLLAGIYLLDDAEPLVVMGVWLGVTTVFCFFWMIGLLSELQRSESIDIPRLLHLPVELGQVFLINYAVSHLSLSLVITLPVMMGLAIGVAVSRGPAMLLMIPLAIAMVLMISAWTYYLRGWLATLMSNPRRRRAVIMGITTAIILISQLPNIYFNVLRRPERASSSADRKETREERRKRQAWTQEEIDRLVRVQIAIPPLWVPLGAKGLAEGRALPALLGTIGALAIGALGLRRAYLSILRFYLGASGGKASARPPARAPTAVSTTAGAPTRARNSRRLLERQLPYVPEPTAAIALASFRAMLRAPEVKMQWGTSFLVTVFVGGSLLFREGSEISAAVRPFITTGIVAFTLFMQVTFVANQFGFDRDGFRAFVLSPVDRSQILAGKNLAVVPVAVSLAGLLVLFVSIWLRLSPVVFAATFLQLIAGLLITAIVGNLLSILFPYRIQPGSMKPTKMPALSMVVLVVTQMCLPIALFPAFIPPLLGYLLDRSGGTTGALVNFALSLILALIAAGCYKAALPALGRLLHNRETKILQTVSAEVE